MRFALYILAGTMVALAGPALAEDVTFGTADTTTTTTTASPPSTTATPTVMQTPNGPVTVYPPGTVPPPVAQTAQHAPAVTVTQPPGAPAPIIKTVRPADDGAEKEAIGFDAKVKRDPYGRVISDGTNPSATPGVMPLRNDYGLRSDKDILKNSH